MIEENVYPPTYTHIHTLRETIFSSDHSASSKSYVLCRYASPCHQRTITTATTSGLKEAEVLLSLFHHRSTVYCIDTFYMHVCVWVRGKARVKEIHPTWTCRVFKKEIDTIDGQVTMAMSSSNRCASSRLCDDLEDSPTTADRLCLLGGNRAFSWHKCYARLLFLPLFVHVLC